MRMLTTNELDRVHGGLLQHRAVNSGLNPELGGGGAGGPPTPGGGAGGSDGVWVPGPFGGSIHVTPNTISYTTPNLPLESWGITAVAGYTLGSGWGVTINATDGGDTVSLTPEGDGSFGGTYTHTSGNSTYNFGITVNVFSSDIEMLQASYTYHMNANVIGGGGAVDAATSSSSRVHAVAA
jgi:hypothetical protein